MHVFVSANVSTCVRMHPFRLERRLPVRGAILAVAPANLADLCLLRAATGAYHRFMKGVQSPTDLEEAFQLVHLLFKTK